MKVNCCCLIQIIKDATRNCAKNKKIDLKLNTKFIFILFVIYELIFLAFVKGQKHNNTYVQNGFYSKLSNQVQ